MVFRFTGFLPEPELACFPFLADLRCKTDRLAVTPAGPDSTEQTVTQAQSLPWA